MARIHFLVWQFLVAGAGACGTSPVIPTLPPGQITNWKDLLGGNVVSEPMPPRNPGAPITNIQELTCNTLVTPGCRWHNVFDNTVQWRRGTGRPSQSRLRSYTASGVPPISVEPYAFAYPASPPQPTGVARFVSDPIRCQRGNAELSFTYWISRNLEVKVCTRQRGALTPLYCSSQLLFNGANGPVYLNIPQPAVQDFEIYIEASKFMTNTDFAIIDDIEYNAVLC